MTNQQDLISKIQDKFPLWLLLWPLAVVLRMTNFYGVFVENKVFLSSTDPYYHLRRIQLTLENFPHVPDFDPYLNFPNGAATHWPFGFDILIATIISFITLGKENRWLMEATSALIPPLVASLIPIVIYLILNKITDKSTALFGGIMAAIMPVAIYFSQIGNLDHHFFASLCQSLLFFTYLQASKKEKDTFWGLLSGAIIFLAFITTTEFPFVIAVHCIYLFLVWFTLDKERQNKLITLNLKIFASTTILLIPCVFTYYFEPKGVSPLLGSSWFGCFAFSILLVILATIKKLIPISISLLSLIFTIICIAKFDFSLISTLLAEANQSQGNNILGSSIRENHSMLSDGLSYLLYWHSGFLLLVPAMIVLLIRQRNEINLLILVSLVFMQSLGLAHMRLSVLLPVPFVLASAILAKEGVIFAKNHFSKNYLGEILSTTIIFLLLLPSTAGIKSTSDIVISHKPFLPIYNSFTWLKEHSPSIDPQAPSYGVLANEWDIGHWLVYFSERPTVSSPLLHTNDLAKAVFEGTKIFVEPPDQAIKDLESRKLKYIFFTPDDFLYLIELSGITPPKADEDFDSLYGRLLASYGFPQGTVNHPALNRLRLVYEGEKLEGDPPLPSSMIFELVKGAKLKGQVNPNATVSLTSQIKTESKRRTPYLATVKADENGLFEFLVPYSTNLDETTTVFSSAYIIKSENLLTTVKVTTKQVREGQTIEIIFPNKTNLSVN
jgi:dolichyl-diphosphooligosaccharide--protein glycosyltransferase